MEKETKMQSFRLETEAVEQFRRYCEENGLSQADGFNHLLRTTELERAKQGMPNREAEITNVQQHAEALVSAYLHSLELYDSAKEAANAAAADVIESKEKLIAILQGQLHDLNDENNVNKKNADETLKALFESEKEVKTLKEAHQSLQDALKDKQTIIDTLERENAKFDALNAKYEDMEKSLAEEKERANVLQQKNVELEMRIRNSEAEVRAAENELKITIQTAVNERKQAVLEVKEEAHAKLEAKDAEINVLREKILELGKQLNDMTATCDRLNAEIEGSKKRKKNTKKDVSTAEKQEEPADVKQIAIDEVEEWDLTEDEE